MMVSNTMRFVIIVLAMWMLTGCQTTTSYYRGASAEEMNVVALSPDQAGKQSWQDLYLQIDYSLKRAAGRMTITGAFTYTLTTRTIYQQVHDLKLKLYLLDAEMRVIDYRQVARSLSRSLERKTTFSEQFELDEQVAAFSFGYEGLLVDEENFHEMIWKVPQRSQ